MLKTQCVQKMLFVTIVTHFKLYLKTDNDGVVPSL
jgi:hypothetical protein